MSESAPSHPYPFHHERRGKDFLCGFSIEMSSLGTDEDVSVGGSAAEVAVMRCNAVWQASARHFSGRPNPKPRHFGAVVRGPTAGTCSRK